MKQTVSGVTTLYVNQYYEKTGSEVTSSYYLGGKLHKDSHNSPLPPSQSWRLPIKNLREKTGKPQGGQSGHPSQTLKMMNKPTYTVRQQVNRCEQCSQYLSLRPVTEYERRQVYELMLSEGEKLRILSLRFSAPPQRSISRL